MAQQQPLIYGIIHIGSSALSMRIVEYRGIDEIKVIEEGKKGITFGEEVFMKKQLSFASIRRLCGMLNGLKQLLRTTASPITPCTPRRFSEKRRTAGPSSTSFGCTPGLTCTWWICPRKFISSIFSCSTASAGSTAP